MPKIEVVSMGKATPWEYTPEVRGKLTVNDEYWYAEIKVDGARYTMYFDVTKEETKDLPAIEKWVKQTAGKELK